LGRMWMSDEERKRNEVMTRVKKGDLGLRNAAEILGISYRQVKRIRKRYRKQGAKGLVHGNVGRKSNRAKPQKFRERALRLVRQKYSGEAGERFGPTLAAEHLASEDGLEVDPETLRRWMLGEGLWSRERKRQTHRRRRERKGHFGGTGAVGRQLRRLVGRTRTIRLLDEFGGRCDEHDAVPAGGARNDLGGGAGVARLDRRVWGAVGAVYGLEERVRERADD